MAALTFYDGTAKRLADGNYGTPWSSAGLKYALSNTTPNLSTHNGLADVTQVSGGNWVSGGISVGTVSTAIDTTDGARVVSNADLNHVQASASVGPFRYVILYADTPTTPTADPVIGYWDYGSSITLNVGETLNINLDANFALFTLSDPA